MAGVTGGSIAEPQVHRNVGDVRQLTKSAVGFDEAMRQMREAAVDSDFVAALVLGFFAHSVESLDT